MKRRCTRRQSGTAMVEMVIVLPLLLTLMFGIAELSIAMMRWQTIGNAAREGAREGSLFRTNCGSSAATAANQAAADALVAANVTGATITVGGTCVTPGSTTVTVTAPYTFILLPNFVATLPAFLTLTSTSVMRNSNLSGA
ncbi:MAG: TadE family protein [Myxococcota bacterium]